LLLESNVFNQTSHRLKLNSLVIDFAINQSIFS
jgi:hypothetical protein